MRPVSTLPERADVVIVGGGFAGAATAYCLARAGVTDVVVLEREAACGYHASGRNAALGRQVTESDRFTELAVRGMEFLRVPPADFGDVTLLRNTGSFLLVDDAHHGDQLAARASGFEVEHRRVSREHVVERWPRLARAGFAEALWFPTDGVIDVHALLSGYLAGAREAGAGLRVGCEVRGFRDLGDGVEVVTTTGDLRAKVVVIAAGAWAGELGSLATPSGVRFSPIQRHLFVTEPLADIALATPFVWHVGAREFYARREGDGLLVSGCDEAEVPACDAQVAAGAIEALAERLSAAAPGLAELGIARRWACLRTFTADRQGPLVDWDEHRPWLFWVAGLGGHGATGSFGIGQAAAHRLLVRLATRFAS